MSLSVKNTGIWKEAKNIHVKNNNTWKEAQGVWVKHGGVWEKAFEPIVAPPSDGMVLEVEIPDGNLGFEIGCYSTSDEYSAEIAWGDGTTSLITDDTDTDLVHTYPSAGTYTIEITGTFPNIAMNQALTIVDSQEKLKKVLNLGHLGFTRLDFAFIDCSLTEFTAGATDTMMVADITSFLRGNAQLTNIDLDGLDTENVTLFVNFFRYCSGIISLDLTTINVQSVESFSGMCNQCLNLITLDVSGWDTSSATNFNDMFSDCEFFTNRTGIADFNIMNLTTAVNMFGNSGISTAEYDELLVNWQAQPHQQGVSISFGDSMYTAGSAAETARQALIDDDGWSIIDDGPVI